MRWGLVALLAVPTACGDCPEDARNHYSDGLTQADICRDNGRRLIVHVASWTPITDEEFANVVAPVGRRVCEDAGCLIVELDQPCCADGVAYFRDLTEFEMSAVLVDPATPCGCVVHWFEQ